MAEGIVDMIEGGEPTNWKELIESDLKKVNKSIKEEKVLFIQRWWKSKLRSLKKMIISDL
jgi:hypothetical protein